MFRRIALACLFMVLVAALGIAAVSGSASKIVAAQPGGGQTYQLLAGNAYSSQRLQAQLMLEWMTIPGYTFWGARIVHMQPTSPLQALNLQLGDVITRLDGLRISTSKFWVPAGPGGGYWALPECERHYGPTEVRFIRSGTQQVQNGQVDLGPSIFPCPIGPDVVVP